MQIRLLNHASVLIEVGSVRLLTDPWFFGTCFDGGWGLRWDAPAAIDQAARATHLWVSHFHEDHFHIPTLKAVLERNPGIVALGNRSWNFQLDAALRRLGFENVVALDERRPTTLAPGVVVERYPATGIDNMLLVRGPGADGRPRTILNYNDCVVPASTRRWLARRFGPIDVFLCNFNHAGKLLRHPLPPVATVHQGLLANFESIFPPFRPRAVLPFASHHIYRAPENAPQNASLLEVERLAEVDRRVVPLRVGETACFAGEARAPRIERHDAGVREAEADLIVRAPGTTRAQLQEAAARFAARIRRAYGPLAAGVPSLVVRVSETGEVVELDPRRGLRPADGNATPDLEAHGSALVRWWSRPYGTDTFCVGAHFGFASKAGVVTFRRLIIAALLAENRLDARSTLEMLTSLQGQRFLWNRREEIAGVLLSRQVGAEYQQPEP